jgi:8-oxo-dGTP pyrophosphatase MutT (NUDIX family)
VSEEVRILHAAEVACLFEPMAWAFAEQNRARIDAHWDGLIANKPALFNGKVLILHRWSLAGDRFTGAYLMTDYKDFIAWRDFGHPDRKKWNCFAMAALRSADGAFLLGEMADHTANGGAVYFAAGTPDPSDLKGNVVDLEGSVLRELEEETGIAPAAVSLPAHWTVVITGQRIALMRPVISSLPATALKRQIETFLASEKTPELSGIHIVRGAHDLIEDRMPLFQRAYLEHALAEGR